MDPYRGTPRPPEPLKAVVILCAASAAFFVFLEWVFFSTVPSFLSDLPVIKRIVVGLIALLAVALCEISLCFIIWQAARWMRSSNIRAGLTAVVPSLVIALALLVMVDTFIYTVFHESVIKVRSGHLWSGAAFVMGFLLTLRETILGARKLLEARWMGRLYRMALAVLLISGALAATRFFTVEGFAQLGSSEKPGRSPDILLVGIDGLEAEHTSLYGAKGFPTPFLELFGRESAVFQNVFCNANVTAASLPSLLTGKTGIKLHKLSSQQILKGINMVRHLPGILKRHGYQTALLGIKRFADAKDWNMRDGFDLVNESGWSQPALPGVTNWLFAYWPEEMYFLEQSALRAWLRLRRCFSGSRPSEELSEFAEWKNQIRMDRMRIQALCSLLETSRKPVFAHVHLMGTHPYEGMPNNPEPPHELKVRGADDRIKEIVGFLKKTGRYDNALIVVYSDHGLHCAMAPRLPLLIHFPSDVGAIDVRANVQNIDIMPTVLDYLGIPIPSDVEGTSLLRPRSRARPIFASGFDEATNRMAAMNVTVCDESYLYEFGGGAVKSSSIKKGLAAPCAPEERPGPTKAKQMMLDYLASHNYAPDGMER